MRAGNLTESEPKYSIMGLTRKKTEKTEKICSLVAHTEYVLESRSSIDRPKLTTQTVQEALQIRELRLLGRRRILALVGELLDRGGDRHPWDFLVCEDALPTP